MNPHLMIAPNSGNFDVNALTGLDFGTPGRLYRSPMPFGPYDGDHSLVQAYQSASISVVVVLAEAEECLRKTGRDLLAYYREQGLEVIHCPIPDFTVPQRQPFEAAQLAVAARARNGQHTVVHCSAGIGRTGLFMACLAHHLLGLDGDAAIARVRRAIPTAVETEDQKQFVREYCT
jgi:protein-tyrosine phosphatase